MRVLIWESLAVAAVFCAAIAALSSMSDRKPVSICSAMSNVDHSRYAEADPWQSRRLEE